VRAIGVLLLLALIGATSPASAAVVARRGTGAAVEGRVIAIDEGGVQVQAESGATIAIPWDSVRRVTMDQPDLRLRKFLPMAEDLWRARSRVQRGDMALAEPLLARLFEQYRGQTHETALIVAEGLLRALLFRGGNEAAIIPALEVGRLRRAGITTDRYGNLEPVLDEESFLCPQLAPAWSRSRFLEAVERDLADYDARGDEVVAEIAALYARAVRQELGTMSASPDEGETSSVGGIPLVRLFVALGSSDPQEREEARNALDRMLPEFQGWREGWIRFALGRSLLMESGVGRQQRGMVELLHVPARFHKTLPYLSGLALAAVEDAASQQGDGELSAVMHAELARLYPNHPVHTAPGAADRTKDSS
jgi:hypothetical protein